MAGLNNGRRPPNVSQYIIATLNTVPTAQEVANQEDENFNLEDDLAIFTNTEFFNFDIGDDIEQPINYDPSQEERARRENATAHKKNVSNMEFGNSTYPTTRCLLIMSRRSLLRFIKTKARLQSSIKTFQFSNRTTKPCKTMSPILIPKQQPMPIPWHLTFLPRSTPPLRPHLKPIQPSHSPRPPLPRPTQLPTPHPQKTTPYHPCPPPRQPPTPPSPAWPQKKTNGAATQPRAPVFA